MILPRPTEPAQKEPKLRIQKSRVMVGELLHALSLGFLSWELGETLLSQYPNSQAITSFPTCSRSTVRLGASKPELGHPLTLDLRKYQTVAEGGGEKWLPHCLYH